MNLIGKNTPHLLKGSRSLQNLGPKMGNPTGCLGETPVSSCNLQGCRVNTWLSGVGGLHRDEEGLGRGVGVCTPQKVSENVLKKQTLTQTQNKQKDKQQNQSSNQLTKSSGKLCCHCFCPLSSEILSEFNPDS